MPHKGRRHCAPGKCAVWRVHKSGRALLPGKIQRAQKRIQRLIRVCRERVKLATRTRLSNVCRAAMVGRGICRRRVIAAEKRRRFVLVEVSKANSGGVARQQFHGNNRFFPDALCQPALVISKTVAANRVRHVNVTGRGARDHRARGGIIERVHLLLVLHLASTERFSGML